MRYVANCSVLFTEDEPLRRPASARAAGFGAIEFWWPFAMPVPPDKDVDRFVAGVADAGVRLVRLNFFAGDLSGADCSILSIPARAIEFRDNVDVVIGIGRRLGVTAFNALYGNRLAGIDPSAHDELATEQLDYAAKAAAAIDAMVLVEAVSGPKPYPLRTAAELSRSLITSARPTSASFATFTIWPRRGDDVAGAIEAYADRIAHVQIADAPGRGEPGTGTLDIAGYLAALDAAGYRGHVGLEYWPTTSTLDSLAWLPHEQRSSR